MIITKQQLAFAGLAAIFSVNFAGYVYIPVISVLPILNAAFLVFYAVAFWRYLWALIPLFLFTPLASHAPGPTFVLTILAITAAELLQKKFRHVGFPVIVASTMLLAGVAILALARAENFDLATHYFEPYVKAIAVSILLATLFKNQKVASSSLKLVATVSASAILFKIAYAANPAELNYAMQVTAEDLRGRVDIYYAGDFVRRLTLIGQDPNYASAIQLVGFGVALALANSPASKGGRWFWIACALVNFVQIAGTYSRSGVIAALIILALFSRKNVKALGLSIAVSVVTFVYVLTTPALWDRMTSIVGDDTGGTHRFNLWVNAVNMWSDNILLGSGLSDYTSTYSKAAHSTYFQVLAEQGVLGLIVLILWMFVALMPAAAYDRERRRMVIAVATGFLLMLQTISFFDVDIFLVCLAYIGLIATIPYQREHVL